MIYGVVNSNVFIIGLPEIMSSCTVPTEQPTEDDLHHGKLNSKW